MFASGESHFGAALPAGIADDVSAGGEVEVAGDCAGGVSAHAAKMAPTDAMTARSATIVIFFMIVLSSEVPSACGTGLLCLSSTADVNWTTFSCALDHLMYCPRRA
jgi:hypothetical protein